MRVKYLIILYFSAFNIDAEDVEFRFFIPAVSEPLVEGPLVGIRSFDGQVIDELSYILHSQETGYYPDWGWTGDHYITGVTHGQVKSERIDEIGVTFFDEVNSVNVQGYTPEPGSLTLFIIFGILLRRVH
jgi:hypothetical protein